MPREAPAHQPLCADIDGFSLHAAVRAEAHERKQLEQLCRYITRPALSEERIQLDAAGQVQLKLKTPWRDGTTHVVMSPLEFMQRLAALVPRPRLHLIRFHGVLAPNARLRALVVPQGPPEQDEPAVQAAGGAECEPEAVQARSHRIGWARLLERVFDIDMQHCPNCGAGQLKIIAAILQRPVIEKILTHLGLTRSPRPGAGRARRGTTEAASRRPCAGRTGHRTADTSQHRLRNLAAAAGDAAPHVGSTRMTRHRPRDQSLPGPIRSVQAGRIARIRRPNPHKATAQAPVPGPSSRHRLPTQATMVPPRTV